VSYESDSGVKIQEPKRKGEIYNHVSLGFSSNKTLQWKAFINVLQDPSHIYELGPANTYSDTFKKKMPVREYGRRQKRLGAINKKLINFFNKEYEAQLPATFQLYELCKEEGKGKYKFIFKVVTDDGIEGDLQSVYEQYPKDQLIDEIYSLPEKYRDIGESIDLQKFSETSDWEPFQIAARVAELKGWLTLNDIEKIFNPDKEEYLPDDDLNVKS
jgi:hypothetical protein